MSSALTTAPAPTVDPRIIAAIYADLQKKWSDLEIQITAAYAGCLVFALTLIVYLRTNRASALRGDTNAARKIILPSYEPLLWIIAFTSFGVGLLVFCVHVSKSSDVFDNILTEVYAMGRVFILTAPSIFMTQKSISSAALSRTLQYTVLIICCFIIPVTVMKKTDQPKETFPIFSLVSKSLWGCLFLYFIIFPQRHRANKRAIREYNAFALGYCSLQLIYSAYFQVGNLSTGLYVVLVTAIYWALVPIPIWRLMQADTEHWRGIGNKSVELHEVLRSQKHVNERISSDGLHVLIEMHRKYIIDFAFLKFGKVLGQGATATVFKGMLNSKTPVAIKVYTPYEVTEYEVAEFSNEAALCGSLRHPNIVNFFGLCVNPPNICLVSELCQGSLEDVMKIQEPMVHLEQIQLCHMLDAARSVAYLQSFTPPFIHRDIKTSNFLVDYNGVVKLTDFGESRSLVGRADEILGRNRGCSIRNCAKWRSTVNNVKTSKRPEADEYTKDLEAPTRSQDRVASCMTVKGTVDFMAPEVMEGKAGNATYGAAADMFSLGITFWDILHPGGMKYPETSNHLRVYQWVLEGRRPDIAPQVHPALQELMRSMWDADPEKRPSAARVVKILEDVQEELLMSVGHKVMDEVPIRDREWKGRMHRQCFVGDQLVQQMVDGGWVNDSSQGVRLGNALMDSGIIHHVAHAQPFENEHYFYQLVQVDNVENFSPKGSDCGIAMLDNIVEDKEYEPSLDGSEGIAPRLNLLKRRANSTVSSQSSLATTTISSVFNVNRSATCNCKKLAQGLKKPKAGRGFMNLRGRRAPKRSKPQMLQTVPDSPVHNEDNDDGVFEYDEAMTPTEAGHEDDAFANFDETMDDDSTHDKNMPQYGTRIL